MPRRICFAVRVYGEIDALVSNGPHRAPGVVFYEQPVTTLTRAHHHADTVNRIWGKGVATIENWSDCADCGHVMKSPDLEQTMCEDCAARMGTSQVAAVR
jgi:hypothetical protein